MAKVREQLQFELDEAKLTKAENAKLREKIQKLQDMKFEQIGGGDTPTFID